MRKPTKRTPVKRRKTPKTKAAPKGRKIARKSVLNGVIRKPKFQKGQFVYSHFNQTEKRQINLVFISKQSNREHKYRLTLSDTKGMPKNSPWITESGLSKRKLK